MIPVEESFAEWRKDPKYAEAYNALEGEFAVAAALIKSKPCETENRSPSRQ
jgi:hypothetical protein